ncbi:putative and tpr domain-containing protein [Phaeoacremonium minimum UCRPA7]|uniref:Tetratricopeptide repeat and J domain-containing co-chaperone DNJ1 n=1 Tax=Phaeoacremonium minimum (strain UCR-PA7) TaxID=1286976 RepID=R8BT15_PHAM7|nr:putative and tpr domain-containing protein [Phaeoacremonium minimum UCRPA7]EOO02527.1 putative and tpr domain-containing protein [Phaeoacremonium minimum UCRPA7]
MYPPLSALALAASLFSVQPALVDALSAQDIPSDTPISSLLSSAQIHLAKGETADALVYYDAAVARDPHDYLTFFKRATTYLSLGRTSQATEDFNKVLSLKPGFEGAHVQLGKIRARGADWDGAREQYMLARKGIGSKEMDELTEAQGAASLAETAEQNGNWDECVSQAGVAIRVATRSVALRELRSRCRFAKGEVEEGMGDLHHILNMKPGDTSPHVKISAITFFALGDLANGMAQIRKCLHSDPESKLCKKVLRQEKSIEKTMVKVDKAFSKNQPMTGTRLLVPSADDEGLIKEVKDQVQAFREDGTIPPTAPNVLVSRLVELACQGYYEMNNKKMKDYCVESLALDENSFYGLLYQSKSQLDAEEFEAAINSLKKAGEARPDKQDVINPLMQKAQVALKRSKTKDYYKVLGVAHDADEKQIKSAYRKLSKQHHPDKAAKQGLTKEDAEKKMASINEAYEVLSDPELRARFDRGDDPNSHEQQNPFQGSPFGGGQPFMFQQGGQGQQFQFKFGSGGGFPGGFGFGG